MIGQPSFARDTPADRGFFVCSDEDVDPHVELSRDNPCRPIDPIDGADCPGLLGDASRHGKPD